MTDIKMLPLPERFSFMGWKRHMRDYARDCVAHATYTKDAEIEALRAANIAYSEQVAKLIGRAGNAEARAERLAEALRGMMDKWDRIGDEHGVRQFTGNDHKLFANELRALLRDHDQEGKDG